MIRVDRHSFEAFKRSPLSISLANPLQPDCPLIFANEQCEEITGYTEHEMVGRNCRLLQCAKTPKTELTKIRKAVRQMKPATACILNQRKCGKLFWNLLILSPLRVDEKEMFLGCQLDLGSEPRAFDIGVHTDELANVLEAASPWTDQQGWLHVRASMKMHAQAVLLIAQTRVEMNRPCEDDLPNIKRETRSFWTPGDLALEDASALH